MKYLGFGLGLRTVHFDQVLNDKPAVDWFEILSENFMVAGGKPKYYLHAIREHYPMAMHGVSLSIGSTTPLDMDYLKRLKQLQEEIEPEWVSDHLCWTALDSINSHDLLPLPYTEEAVEHISTRIRQVQDYLQRPLVVENLSTYVRFADSQMSEWEFINEIVRRADCKLLLDINNIYVSARNHGFDPRVYVDAMDPLRIQQYHLAGGTDYGSYVIDTHDQDVPHPVWDLYQHALHRLGLHSTSIERDANIPPLEELLSELDQARHIATPFQNTREAVAACR